MLLKLCFLQHLNPLFPSPSAVQLMLKNGFFYNISCLEKNETLSNAHNELFLQLRSNIFFFLVHLIFFLLGVYQSKLFWKLGNRRRARFWQ